MWIIINFCPFQFKMKKFKFKFIWQFKTTQFISFFEIPVNFSPYKFGYFCPINLTNDRLTKIANSLLGRSH